VQPPEGLPKLEWPTDSGFGGCLGLWAIMLLVGSGYLLHHLIGPSPHWSPLPAASGIAPAPAVWVFAIGAILFWIPWVILRQPTQQRRTRFVEWLRSGELDGTMRELAALGPRDFPPGWHPASTLARLDLAPRMLGAVQAASRLPAGSWVRADFLERFGQMLPIWLDPIEVWQRAAMSSEELASLASVNELLRRLPEGPQLAAPYQDYLAELSAHAEGYDRPRSEILQSLLALTLKRGSKR
jgi:hypothetical protein